MRSVAALFTSIVVHGILALALYTATHRVHHPTEMTHDGPITLGDPVLVGALGASRLRGGVAKKQPASATTGTPMSTVDHPTSSPVAGSSATGGMRNTYLLGVLAALQERQTYPAMAQARAEEGVVELSLTITRDGQVREADVVRSSGSMTLDNAALDLVRTLPAAVLKVPDEITDVPLKLLVPLRYRLQ